ncbi:MULTISPECIES: deoxyribose-phosphate aldolase [unclassified Mycolicibacterium]|uniref:deoxyribose-phosphate aldolase n=1 Tax=unclassified Mycolicibacterium TaxID=2636767 RepID=UPI0012DD9648|nr:MULTISPECIES: deoxyribose-phosphate aldolase [unclassified Mycolicibacterium]MUL84481.1 deoxyribose-phosphate aldolase [Mycolicibacterium sp. CBMA 329]MUL88256.1 deoxyribose-phosphate aldolase [Mycolicibacterium sp. CBMA 331]MUL99295.1 deoxyribose-phosphate aldolase [Mycolicibacterium sp. CBMA 334]MUM28118.1 deoxyribose-phosphate aldolase [Mycolicibacterium sp. CBMA 295]MUM39903.1 deoxyribose-phosphate aldolase [Mycolicibacterium sp. CBMA 247]
MTNDTQPTAAQVAAMIDHTLLKPEATAADVAALVAEALELGTYSVCVSPSMLPVDVPSGSTLKVAAVCGFPSGKHSSQIKAAEAAEAVRLGADEIDMVIDIGAAKDGAFDRVEADIAAVRAAAPAPAVLKVIIESAALTDEEIVGVCRAAVAAQADFVKTSTGFHPTGGATVHAVELMHRTVHDAGLAVKASGGVRTLEQAQSMITAGATRLGVSGSRALLSASGPETASDY